jgi:predicted acylesterase/phospholipase RssA
MDTLTRRDAIKSVAAGIACSHQDVLEGEDKAREKYLILACDGGGVRGLLTALLIQQLESDFPFLNRVKLFAGTSTGGILALGLAKGLKVESMVRLYEDKGPSIFRPYKPAASDYVLLKTALEIATKSKFFSKLKYSLRDCFHVKFDNAGLKEVLGGYLGKDSTFEDLPPGKAALVTTLRLSSADEAGWTPLVLHNLPTTDKTLKTRLVDAALATSAAPLYFPPYKVEGFGYCVDGGLFANCPAGLALATALRARPSLESIRVLSIGTGAGVNRMMIPQTPFNKDGDYGMFAWLAPKARDNNIPSFPLISALFDASSAADDLICQRILGERYHRIQVQLKQPIPLDDHKQVGRLEVIAKAFIKNSPAWKAAKEWLSKNRP